MQDATPSRSGLEIFPFVPILCAMSIVCCLLLVPGFTKTRVFALAFYVWWLILGCTMILVNTCIWRGNVRNIPIYADIVARIWSIYSLELYAAMLCVNKLIWTISRPAPSVKVYDNRLRMNRIDVLLCAGLPLLLLPVYAVTSPGRYSIIEDLGPWDLSSLSLDTWLLQQVPLILVTCMSISYSCRSICNFYRARTSKRIEHIESGLHLQHRALSVFQVFRYCSLALFSIAGMIFGVLWINLHWIYWGINSPPSEKWYFRVILLDNWPDRNDVWKQTRKDMEDSTYVLKNLMGFTYSVPLSGIQLFLWFGLGMEARKSYFQWLRHLGALVTGTWVRILLREFPGKMKRRMRPNQVDWQHFTPFQLDDIRSEEVSNTVWSASNTTLGCTNSVNEVRPPSPYPSKVTSERSLLVSPPMAILRGSVKHQRIRNENVGS